MRGGTPFSAVRVSARMVSLQTLQTLQTALVVRWIHFLALAGIFGGAVLLWAAADPPRRLARRYEAGFWLAAALLVVTGVGNVGALAPTVPAIGTHWGRVFAIKLTAVALLFGFSLARTTLVARADRPPARVWYAVTALWVAALVGAAVVMVRG